MAILNVIGGLILSVIISYNIAMEKMIDLKEMIITNYRNEIKNQTYIIKEGVINYCNDNNISDVGQPSISDLYNNKYIYNNTILNNDLSIDWGSDSNIFTLNLSVKNSTNTIRTINIFLNSFGLGNGINKSCDSNPDDTDFGKCSVDIPIGIKCE